MESEQNYNTVEPHLLKNETVQWTHNEGLLLRDNVVLYYGEFIHHTDSVVMISLELCTIYGSSSPVVAATSFILCFNKHRLTQAHLENGQEATNVCEHF